jgi:hypothetical protein
LEDGVAADEGVTETARKKSQHYAGYKNNTGSNVSNVVLSGYPVKASLNARQ